MIFSGPATAAHARPTATGRIIIIFGCSRSRSASRPHTVLSSGRTRGAQAHHYRSNPCRSLPDKYTDDQAKLLAVIEESPALGSFCQNLAHAQLRRSSASASTRAIRSWAICASAFACSVSCCACASWPSKCRTRLSASDSTRAMRALPHASVSALIIIMVAVARRR
jgi:hypothetical protein